MADSLPVSFWYGPSSVTRGESYDDSVRTQQQTKDLKDALSKNTAMVVAANVASAEMVTDAIGAMQSDMVQGFSWLAEGVAEVSREIGEMDAHITMGIAKLETTVQQSANAICKRLDSISDTLKNPSLTQAREYYVRAETHYAKGFYEEALEEIKECTRIYKVDYIAWFLAGKIYLFGTGDFSNVVDLDAAIQALTNAAKYITPDSKTLSDASLLASDIWFHLALAKQNKVWVSLHGGNREGSGKLLGEAVQEFEQSYTYSNKMLMALYNAARCHTALKNIGGALKWLELIIKEDRSFASMAAVDGDFNAIRAEFKQLIDKLRSELYLTLREPFARYRALMAEAKELQLSGIMAQVPPMLRSLGDAAAVPQDMPYIDMRVLRDELSEFLPLFEETVVSARKWKNGLLAKLNTAKTELNNDAQSSYDFSRLSTELDNIAQGLQSLPSASTVKAKIEECEECRRLCEKKIQAKKRLEDKKYNAAELKKLIGFGIVSGIIGGVIWTILFSALLYFGGGSENAGIFLLLPMVFGVIFVVDGVTGVIIGKIVMDYWKRIFGVIGGVIGIGFCVLFSLPNFVLFSIIGFILNAIVGAIVNVIDDKWGV